SGQAPLRLVEGTAGRFEIKTRSELDVLRLVVIDPRLGRVHSDRVLEAVDAGASIEVEVPGPWALVLAGVAYFGGCWEGRAALLAPTDGNVVLSAPAQAEPGEEVTLELRGPATAS